MTQLSRENLDKAFALLVEAAVKGERCPVSTGPGQHSILRSEIVSALAHAGRVSVEISRGNFRRVTILAGEHKGRSTAANPDPNARVYQTIDSSGRRINGRLTNTGAAKRPQPSAPRLLTREELSR